MEPSRRFFLLGDAERGNGLRDKIVIFAYLEELATVKSAIHLHSKESKELPIQGAVESVEEEKQQLQVSLSRALSGKVKEQEIFNMFFTMDGQRFRMEIPFQERSGYLRARFKFPTSVFLDDRRFLHRVRFSARDKSSVVLLESFHEGKGAKGRLVNLSLGGIALRLDSVVTVHDQKRQPLTPEVLQIGSHLDFVRIFDLPYLPKFECRGEVAHIAPCGLGLVVGIRFVEIDPLEQQLLAQVLRKLAPDVVQGFPIRYPKSHRHLQQEIEPACAEEETWELEEKQGKPPPEPVQDIQDNTANAEARERLQRLKKRGRQLLIILLDDLDRMILAGTLMADGYLRIAEARNYLETIAWLKSHEPDVVILEHHVGMHNAQQVIQKLRSQGFLEKTPIIMIAEPGDVRATIQAKAVGINRIIRSPINYDGELKAILMELLGIS